MNHRFSVFSFRRAAALLLSLLLLLCQLPFAALAEGMQPVLSISLSWVEGDIPQQQLASEVTASGYEGSYWLYVPAAALQADAVLHVQDNYGLYAFLSIADGTPLSMLGYQDAGVELNLLYTDLLAYDAQGQIAAQYRLYISTQTDTPTTSAPAQIEVPLQIFYVDMQGNQLNQTFTTVRTGDNYVQAEDGYAPDGYTLVGDRQVYVNVDSNGNCTPASVTFVYNAPAPQITEVSYTINYYDMQGNFLNQEVRVLPVGTQDVWADDTKVPEGYTIAGNNYASVTVYNDGTCQPDSLTFYYNEPAPQITEVSYTINYYDMQGNFLNQEVRVLPIGTQDVWADDTKVPEGYTIAGNSSASVTVLDDGTCQPDSLTFYYNEPAPQITEVSYTINYYDMQGNFLNQEVRVLPVGTQDVWADDTKVPEGYTIAGNNSASVTVYNDGTCQPDSLTFYYNEPAPQITEVSYTINYYDTLGNFLNQEVRVLPVGTQDVWADDTKVPEGYTIAGNNFASVTVYNDGTCQPDSLTFYYNEPAPQITEVSYTINYYDMQGNFLNQEVRVLPVGTLDVWADDTKVPEGYTIAGNNFASVTVLDDGICQPDSLTFYYNEPAPQITEVQLQIFYVDADNNPLNQTFTTVRTGDNYVQAEDGYVPDGYTLLGDRQVYVSVDAGGVCTPASVTFVYSQPAPQITQAPFTIVYLDTDGNVLYSQEQTLTSADSPANIFANDLLVPSGYVLQSDNPVTVTLGSDGVCTPAQVTFIYSAPAVAEVNIPVYYYDRAGNVLLQTTAMVRTGENQVAANADLIGSDYQLDSESPVRVLVDESGVCSPEQVSFYFLSTAPTPTPAPVEVIIHYVDENGAPIASDTTVRCVAGLNPVRPAPVDLPDNYQLSDVDNVQYVFVDENGADQAEITFHYALLQTPAVPTEQPTPDPQLALVPVSYRLENVDKPFYTDTPVTCFSDRENVIVMDSAHVPQGYTLISAETVYVTVDANGKASPETVEFIFSLENYSRTITIYYRDLMGQEVATPQTAPVYMGTTGIDLSSYPPVDLRAGYQHTGADSFAIVMYDDGTLSADSVTFTYEALPTETPGPTDTPAPTVFPYVIYDMDGYCYPKSNGTNFRSDPAIKDDNVLRTVSTSELGRVEGYVINASNETWYIVSFSEQVGFIKGDRIRLLTQDEINALFGYTPAPTATPIPDGAAIDRWGSVNDKSVAFRQTAGGSILARAQKDDKIFVYESVTIDGTQWYRAHFNGADGYMMAKFINLMSQADSDAYQGTLSSPMPVRTPEPTATPTAAPTQTPTLAPTDVPTIAPTDVPPFNTGYALTLQKVDLRTGASVSDITLATLPAGTLVYLWGQAYVDGVAWDSAQALALDISGFLPDSVLRKLTAEEAAPYIAAIQPQETPTIQPTAQPDPFSGYAVTKGSNVMIRNYADDKAQIAQVLGEGEVLYVIGQEYVSGYDYFWEVVRYGNIYGYVRSDQLRRMGTEEQAEYEASLRTPMPSPEATVTAPPVSQGSTSSYGYVTTNNVRLRSGAGTNYNYIRMMNKYAFALVLGTEEINGVTWYHINQSGTEGYVMGDYFKVLTLGELTEFLTSDGYRQSSANSSSSTDNTTSVITPVEDFNSGVWKNPTLSQASYEPFTPITTPTVNVEQLATATIAPTATPTIAPMPTTNFTDFTTPAPTTKSSGSGWVWAVLAGVAVLAGGGAYGYSIHRANQRRAAQRAAQRRQAQQQQQARAAQANAYARPTQQYPRQSAQQSSVFTPPTPRTQQPGVYTPQQSAQAYQQPQQSAGQQTGADAPSSTASSETRHRRSDRHQG